MENSVTSWNRILVGNSLKINLNHLVKYLEKNPLGKPEHNSQEKLLRLTLVRSRVGKAILSITGITTIAYLGIQWK